MWSDLAKQVPYYTSGVLTALDEHGYPYSVRVSFTLDHDAQQVQLVVPAGAALGPGPASLLLHSFDAKLWNLRSYMVRGALQQEAGRWCLVPEQYTPGMSQRPADLIRFTRAARSRAAAYLKARRLPRPAIPWDDIQRIKKEAGV